MKASSFHVAVAALAMFSMPAPAFADDIAISSEEYAQIPADTQEKLVAEMKKKGLLAAEDTVSNTAKSDDKEVLESSVFALLIPGVCKLIAEKKKQEELAKCAKKAEKTAQTQCQSEVEGKLGAIGAVCGAIKLF